MTHLVGTMASRPCSNDVHQGFRGLSEYLRTHSPRLLVHGHQHISRETLVESTRVVAVYGHAFIET